MTRDSDLRVSQIRLDLLSPQVRWVKKWLETESNPTGEILEGNRTASNCVAVWTFLKARLRMRKPFLGSFKALVNLRAPHHVLSWLFD